jgi:hypothetical protein
MQYCACLTVLGGLALAWVSGAAEEKKGIKVKLDGLTSVTPADWKEEQPPARYKKMRYKQFRLPRAEGDKKNATVVINFFGKGSGGGVAENVKRWKGMFTPPPKKTLKDVITEDKFMVGKVQVTTLEAYGTYKSPPFEGGKRFPNYRMVKVYFASPNGPYFVTLLGPDKTVEKYKKGFIRWLKGFK